MPRPFLYAALFALTACAGSAIAQTAPSPQSTPPGYAVTIPSAARAPASPEVVAARHTARQACAADVAKLCADVQSAGGKVMQCVRQHRAEVSPGCSSALGALRDARRVEKG